MPPGPRGAEYLKATRGPGGTPWRVSSTDGLGRAVWLVERCAGIGDNEGICPTLRERGSDAKTLRFWEQFGFAITVDADLAHPRVPKDTSAANAAMRRSRWYLRRRFADGVPANLPPDTNRIGRSARKPHAAVQAYGEAALPAAIRADNSMRGLTLELSCPLRRGAWPVRCMIDRGAARARCHAVAGQLE